MVSEQSHDTLRLLRSPVCGYELAGLPVNHRCPECAFEYNNSMAMIPAWPKNPNESTHPGIQAIAVVAVGAIVVLIPIQAINFWLIVGGVLLAGVAISAWMEIRRERRMNNDIGDVDLFLDTQSVVIRRPHARNRAHPWRRFRHATIRYGSRRSKRIRRDGVRRWLLKLNVRYPARFVKDSPQYYIQCTKRQAALLRNELNRRIRKARQTSK